MLWHEMHPTSDHKETWLSMLSSQSHYTDDTIVCMAECSQSEHTREGYHKHAWQEQHLILIDIGVQ